MLFRKIFQSIKNSVWAPHGFRLSLVCALAVSCGALGARQEPDATKSADARQEQSRNARPRVTTSVVFNDAPDFVDRAKTNCQDFSSDKLQDCFAREMKKAKAPPAAVEFSKQLGEPGFVRGFKSAGPVDIAYVLYPYRANEQQSCLIVNGEPPVVDVDNHKLVGPDALKGNARFVALSRGHEEVSLWPGDRYSTETPDVEMGANDGARIVVNYRLREQCHACEVLGHGWYLFAFDPMGHFEGAKVMAVSVTREKAVLVRDARKPIAAELGEEVNIALPVLRAASNTEWKLSKALDTHKVRLIEHTHVAPPTRSGAEGREEIWKFAALGLGATEIEFQKVDGVAAPENAVKFRVTVRGADGAAAGAGEAKREE